MTPSVSSRLLQLWKTRRTVRWVVCAVGLVGIILSALQAAIRIAPFEAMKLLQQDLSTVITDRDGRFLRAYLSRDERWRFPAEIESVSPLLISATIATEDKRFYEHRGIDWTAVARAALSNLKAGRIVSGASTISMQVAGFAIDHRDRTLRRKLRQAFLALQLEHHLTKTEILECYLTHASYGGNVCGVQAAARRYFNKTAKDLSPGESTLLAGLPQSPERLRPDRNPGHALKRREHVLSRLVETGEISENEKQEIVSLPVPVGTFTVPVTAPHFCDQVHQMHPGRTHVRTTLDLQIQERMEQVLDTSAAANRKQGINSYAAIVLHNKTGEIRAFAGSADYWNSFDEGQVNAALSYRSPGSILKPLIFASALDSGAIAPGETLFDVPLNYAGYAPQNFDRQFRGPVSVEKALAWSLNIPAIDVLQRVGVPRFQDILGTCGVPLKINKYGSPGLSLAIGTCSVRLLDMVRMYSSLANGGVVYPAKWTPDSSSPSQETPWVNPGAAAVVIDALVNEQIRSTEDVVPSLAGISGIAWKTGTSNGFKDAWTVAMTPSYTIGVWAGNMNGRSSSGLIGSKAAAPAALTIAADLKRPSDRWPNLNDYYQNVAVCEITKLPAGEHCVGRTSGEVLAGVNLRKCPAHQQVLVDKNNGFCLCTRCSGGVATENYVCVDLPASAAAWLRSNSHPWTKLLKAPHNPACQVAGFGTPPVITAPARGSETVLLSELAAERQMIELVALTSSPNEKLFWFLNGSFVGTSEENKTVRIVPVPGRHKIICTDKVGRSAESWFVVTDSQKVIRNEEIKHVSASLDEIN